MKLGKTRDIGLCCGGERRLVNRGLWLEPSLLCHQSLSLLIKWRDSSLNLSDAQRRAHSSSRSHSLARGSTYRRRDSPAPHARDLEASLLHLLVGQLDVEVELVVAGADDDLAALLGEVGNTRVKLDVTVIFEGLT